MEMIDRYIYAVTQRLPQSQREDIAKELNGLIEDMLDERVHDGEITEKDVEEVLLELGNPKVLATKYRGTKRYIIGPELFDSYISVLKIVMISIVIAMSVVFVVEVAMDPVAILDHFVSYIVSVITTIPMGVGWLTLVFAFIEYYAEFKPGDLKQGNKKTWKPSDLAPIPDPKRTIKQCEPIAGIVFYVLLIIGFSFASQYFGVYIFKDNATVIPFLNEVTISTYLLPIILLLGFSIVKECLKLVAGKWTLRLVLYTTLINAISLILVIFIVTGPAFWNPNFMNELVQSGLVVNGSDAYATVSKIWEFSTTIVIISMIIGLIWDVVNGFIKIRK